jgi:hypothetical protein
MMERKFTVERKGMRLETRKSMRTAKKKIGTMVLLLACLSAIGALHDDKTECNNTMIQSNNDKKRQETHPREEKKASVGFFAIREMKETTVETQYWSTYGNSTHSLY